MLQNMRKKGLYTEFNSSLRDKQKTDTKENFFVWSKLSLDW